MYLFPAIDLRDGQVVRLYQGDYDKQTTYGDDPVAQAQRFADAGATFLHVVDLNAARTGTMTHLPIIERIASTTGLRVEFGGGVRDDDAIARLVNAGVSRIVVGTAALTNWTWFEQAAHRAALANKLVLGLDAKKGKLAVHGWETTTEATPPEVAKKVNGWPLAGIVFTDIATDGTLQGPNYASTRELAEATTVPVIASGGVGTLEHLRRLRDLPIYGAIVGRALYDGAFTIQQAIGVLERGE
ncbi:MAG: 1-(5-phosphoribosyl)-5-[(5-phosphoribosylamino)methylideneamino]imidazole-4-carboxamide isomerase [Phycisphaeraceae bacterium]